MEVSVTIVGGSGKRMPYTLRADDSEVGKWLLRTIVNPEGPSSAGVGEDVTISVAVKGLGPVVGSPAMIRAVRERAGGLVVSGGVGWGGGGGVGGGVGGVVWDA